MKDVLFMLINITIELCFKTREFSKPLAILLSGSQNIRPVSGRSSVNYSVGGKVVSTFNLVSRG